MWPETYRPMFKNQLSRVALAIFFGLCSDVVAGQLVTRPCEFNGVCKLVNPIEFPDDWGSGGIKFVDKDGRELVFSYFEQKVYFKSGEGTKIESQPGTSEEQCLLKVLKESFAAVYDPKLDKKPSDADKPAWQPYLDQLAIKHFIRVLERRCASKPAGG